MRVYYDNLPDKGQYLPRDIFGTHLCSQPHRQKTSVVTFSSIMQVHDLSSSVEIVHFAWLYLYFSYLFLTLYLCFVQTVTNLI